MHLADLFTPPNVPHGAGAGLALRAAIVMQLAVAVNLAACFPSLFDQLSLPLILDECAIHLPVGIPCPFKDVARLGDPR